MTPQSSTRVHFLDSGARNPVLGGNVSEFVHPIVEIELKRHRKL